MNADERKYMKVVRIIFVLITLGWTLGAVAGFTDPAVTSSAAKLTILITATGCWGVIASWNKKQQ